MYVRMHPGLASGWFPWRPIRSARGSRRRRHRYTTVADPAATDAAFIPENRTASKRQKVENDGFIYYRRAIRARNLHLLETR